MAEQASNLGEFTRHPLLQQHNRQTGMLGRQVSFAAVLKIAKSNDSFAKKALNFIEVSRKIGGDDSELEAAKERLRRMRFFGITEHFNESCRLFFRTYGLRESPIYDLNKIPPDIARRRSHYTDEDIAAVKSANRLDIQLYEFAMALFKDRMRTSALPGRSV